MRLYIFIFIFFPQLAFSALIQDQSRFNHLTVQDGLASHYVTDIHQDQKGFIWICTANGLNRYDGNTFKVYRHEPDNQNSLSHSSTNSIAETKDGILWIATINGLNRLDPQTETIQRFFVNSQHRIPKILLSKNSDILWIATRHQGLICFNTKTFEFHYIKHNPEQSDNSLCSNTIQALYIDHLNYLWIATINGLNRYDFKTKTFLQFKSRHNDKSSLYVNRVNAIYEDNNARLWIGTDGRIQQLNMNSNQFKTIYPDRHEEHINIKFIRGDKQNNIWFGTSHDGVWMFNQKKSQWKNFKNNNSKFSIGENSLQSFLQDSSGAYWFGFTGKGISLLFPEHKKIQWITSRQYDIKSIGGNTINGIIEDHQGKIWLGINGFGLDRIDLETGNIKHYKANKNNPEQLISPTVVSLLEDHQNNIWIGTWGAGLECLDTKTDIFSHYQHDPDNSKSISANVITDIYEDSDHFLWISTWGGGLNRFDFKTKSFKHYRNAPENSDSIRDNRIIDIYEDSNKTLWLSLIGGGADRFDRSTETFIHFTNKDSSSKLLLSSTIHCFYEDQNHEFWLGTISRGLIHLNRKNGHFKIYSTRDGLCSNLVAGILEDDSGNLWISTDNGLSRFNTKSEKFRNYDTNDGLTSPYFNMRSALKSKNGQFFFGGNKGINLFYPEDLKQNSFIPPIVMTDFQLFNQSVPVGRNSVLSSNICYMNKLVLTHEKSVFTLRFAALNFISSQKNLYAYHMSNVDKDWVYVDSSRPFATYTKLPNGNYTFKVKGSNNDGIWNEDGILLNITILAPWWQTLWFKMTLFWGIILCIFLYFHIRFTRIKKTKKELEFQVDQRTKELQQSNQQLANEMDRFSTVMSSLNLYIYVADLDTYELLFVNKKIRDVFGDVEGKICWQSLQYGQTGPCTFCTNDKLLDSSGNPCPIYVWKFQNTKTHRWYYIQNSAIKWRDSRWVRLEIATDITEIVQAEKELKNAKEKAESASKAKTLFLANMSHELRTPLNTILGFCQLILQSRQLLPKHMEYLHSIQRSGEHLHSLISDILNISKIEENHEIINKRPTDLRSLIKDIKKMMQMAVHNKGLKFNCDICFDLPKIIWIDDIKLRQILINIISNAIKFTDKGYIALRVSYSLSQSSYDHNYLHFEIEDTGKGISDSDPNVLFDTFIQSSDSKPGDYEGVGLGLSICKKYINLMGGKIWAKNNEKKGAGFYFQIPADIAETNDYKIIHEFMNIKMMILSLTLNIHIKFLLLMIILIIDDFFLMY